MTDKLKKIYKDDSHLFQDKDTLNMALGVCIIMGLLGIVLAIISYLEHNTKMVIVSLVYGPLFIISFFVTLHTQKIHFFLITGFILSYVMEIVYLLTGGQEGFGILWMCIITFFTFFINTNKVFFIVNFFYVLLLLLGFWTPLSQFCYQYTPAMRIRFPILYLIEIIFAAFIKIKISKTEKSRNEIINELLELKNNLSNQVEERTKQLANEKEFSDKLLIEVTQALATTIDAKDKYTSGHSKRVADYSKKLAKLMNLSDEEQNRIYLVGLLHDIGKIGIPDEIINKRDSLTDEEYQKVKEHPTIGFEILKNIKTMPDFEIGVRWHHERFDGHGYPDHLTNEKIPLFAQIISVADAYDAMTSNRSYRKYLPQDKVRSEFEKGKGTQFNPEIATKMIELIDLDINYVMHE